MINHYTTDKNIDFEYFTKMLFDENVLERYHHGMKPYKNYKTYLNTNREWLEQKYKDEVLLDE